MSERDWWGCGGSSIKCLKGLPRLCPGEQRKKMADFTIEKILKEGVLGEGVRRRRKRLRGRNSL